MLKPVIRILCLCLLVLVAEQKAQGQLPAGFQETTLFQMGQSIAVQFLPDGRMLLAQKNGFFRIAEPPLYNNPVTYMQITNIDGSQERGVTSVELDPDFATNGFFYVYYSPASPQNFRVSRFQHQENSGGLTSTGNLLSETVIWQDPNIYVGCCHFGGGMDIGPDGKLYLCTGEISSSSDVPFLDNAYGKIIRTELDGSVPIDNPYNDGAGPNYDYIWAYGLRNPFRAFWDSTYGQFYVGEVGGNNQALAREEVHIASAGSNLGWPFCEGDNCNFPSGQFPADYSPVLFSYGHNGPFPGGAIIGGPVYRGSMFPSQYQGSLFIGDYVQNVVRVLELDLSGTIVLNDFVWHTNPGLIVDMRAAPDGSMILVDLLGNIKRVTYSASNTAPSCDSIAVLPDAAAIGTNISASASVSDVDGDPISWTWDFGDGTSFTGNLSGTGSLNVPQQNHVFSTSGVFPVSLSLDDGTTITNCPVQPVEIGSAPTATIDYPADGSLFNAGDLISFGGSGFDPNGSLTAANFTWEVMFLHNEHVHPELPQTSGFTQGNFQIPLDGHDYTDSTGYEIRLQVTDAEGLHGYDTVRVYPNKTQITFVTNPPGLVVEVDGVPQQTPFIVDDVVGFHHYIHAITQCSNSSRYGFASWSIGGTAFQQIIVPNTDATITANFNYWGACQNQLFLDAKVFLQGPFDVVSGLMNDDLRVQNLIPLAEPNTAAGLPQVGSGGETIQPSVLQVTGNNAIVDWVLIEFRSKVAPAQVLATFNCLLQRDGDIVGLDGQSDVLLSVSPDEYYLAVRHRNHLGCMTGNTVNFDVGTTSLDFTDLGLSTFGTQAQFSNTWINMLWKGNTNADGIIKYSGSANDRDMVLVRIGGNVPTAVQQGYYREDCNLDGYVKYSGALNDRDQVLQGVGGAVPTATRVEQLP